MVTLSLLALLCMSAAPDAGTRSSSLEASVGWREDPALDLKGALARGTDAPVFAAYDGGWCVDIGRWAEPDKPTRWSWASVLLSTEPATAPRSCQTLEAIKPDLALLAERCSGGYPETGKPRHSPVYNHWIRLKDWQLWIEPIPGESCCSPQTKPFVLAEWTGAVFKTSQGSWAKLLTLRELYTP